jgi:aminoglycoside phosphotransferase (APT) family kinase protein
VRFPVPAPLHRGQPTDFYPWPWSIVPWIDGEQLSGTFIGSRSGLAADLAAFVGDLHAPAPSDAPQNPVRGVPLHTRDEVVLARLAGGTVPRSEELLRLWQVLRETDAWSGPPLWLHGDLHPGNLLVLHGRLAGVIDFGDLTAGDPATDLAVGWLAFDAPARQVFLSRLPSAYRTDQALLARARGWALVLATVFTAHSDDNPEMSAIGRHAIEQILVG